MSQKHHDEQGDDEIYLGMLNADHFDRAGWKTKRQGADSIEYEPGLLPVFIKRAEVEEEAGKVTHPGVVCFYKRMLSSGSGEIKKIGRDRLRLIIEIDEVIQDLDERRALFGFELHANVIPAEPDGQLHDDSHFTWLTPLIVDTIRFLLDSTFKQSEKVASEFHMSTPGAPTDSRPIEQIMSDYKTGADVEFPEDLDTVKPEKIAGENEGFDFADLEDRLSGPF